MQKNHQKIENILILRTSSLGDICHMLPFINTLIKEYPKANKYWVIGKEEADFLQNIEGINFVIFDKKNTIKSYFQIKKQLRNINFDIMFLLQVSIRANLISLFVKSKIKLGYDRARSSDFHSLFSNMKIEATKHSHVVDVFLSFLKVLGLEKKDFLYSWKINQVISNENLFAKFPELKGNYFVLSPCSRSENRNWLVDRYAYIADYISDKYGLKCVISSSKNSYERNFVKKIINQMTSSPLNLSGQTNLHELLSVIKNSEFLISPDSGPIHIATCANTPVIGLYGVTNTTRAGPYNSIDLCVDKYNSALKKYTGKKPEEANWRYKNNHKDVMRLIGVDEVREKVDKLFLRGA
tara:strand:+ start:1710 stop:2768 length:1059 start_codon:yes stop_codon:yes gene_type:complete